MKSFFYGLCLSVILFAAVPALAGRENVPFGESVDTCLSQELIWSQLNLAKTDSLQSDLWPKNHSKVSGQGLVLDSVFSVTSYINSFVQPTYQYRIVALKTGVDFEYTAEPSHPFIGGARIQIKDHGSHRSFSWQGSYLIKDTWWGQVSVFQDFVQSSFQELRLNIQRLEEEHCLSSNR
jgi:hypothetical protein